MKTILTPTRWIMAVPVISTGHITADDAERLDRQNETGRPGGLMGVLNQGCGYLLHLSETDPDALAAEWPGYSPHFHALLRHLVAAGFQYVRLDGEGDTLPTLPTFDW